MCGVISSSSSSIIIIIYYCQSFLPRKLASIFFEVDDFLDRAVLGRFVDLLDDILVTLLADLGRGIPVFFVRLLLFFFFPPRRGVLLLGVKFILFC